jgi:heptosyltransferase-1
VSSEDLRLLLLRTSALGDVVHCLPVLRALRRQRPRARLAWVVEEGIAPLLAGHRDLDQVIPVRLRAWRRRPFAAATWRELRAYLAAVDAFAPNAVLDLMGNHKAGLLAALSGVDRRVGAARAHRREPSSAWWISDPVVPRGVHAADRALSLLAGLGIGGGADGAAEPADFGAEALLPGPPPAAALALLATAPPPLVLLQAGAGWGNKRYPPELLGEVAARLADRASVRVLAAPGEEPLALAVREASGYAAEVWLAAGLPALVALLRGAALVVGGDTGPVHLAHAMGTGVLCLMGPTDPLRHGPYAAPQRALQVPVPCRGCYRRLAAPRPCLWALPPRVVAERAWELLAAP